MTNIDEILARLNPKTAAAFRKATEINIEKLETPSLGINRALGGGLRYGQIHTFWGSRSAGKTLMCLGLARNALSENKTVAWLDVERNFDPFWANRNGVDPDQVIVSNVSSMVEAADVGVDLVRSGVDLLVIDSSSALLPQSYFADGEMKSLADTNQIGTFAKNMTSMFNMINSCNQNTCVVNISQVRNKISTYGASKSLTGGEAIEFLSSTILKFWSTTTEKDQIVADVVNGDTIISKPVGRPVTWTITKSRSGGMGMSDSYDMYFDGDSVGVDLTGEIIDLGIKAGIIAKGGAWLTVEGERLQGRAKAVTYLRNNPDIQELLYKKIISI